MLRFHQQQQPAPDVGANNRPELCFLLPVLCTLDKT
jgi:hypothetical protein